MVKLDWKTIKIKSYFERVQPAKWILTVVSYCCGGGTGKDIGIINAL